MAILLSKRIENVSIGKLTDIAKRLSGSGTRGTNMGDWIGILREVGTSNKFRNVPENTPFYELAAFVEGERVDAILQRLADARNDNAHGRGPKGAQVPSKFREHLGDLEEFMRACEFVTDYPLRYIERTKWGSIKQTNTYSYRDLTGDHPLVPLASGKTTTPFLEVNSLYLVDRAGEMHLLRPLLTREQCPVCGNRSTFVLDSYTSRSDTCHLKSLEDGHTHENNEIAEAFRHTGMLLSRSPDG